MRCRDGRLASRKLHLHAGGASGRSGAVPCAACYGGNDQFQFLLSCRQLPKIYCFSSFVIVFFPPDSLAENVTLSPACNVSNKTPCSLFCSIAPPVFAPTVPLCVC